MLEQESKRLGAPVVQGADESVERRRIQIGELLDLDHTVKLGQLALDQTQHVLEVKLTGGLDHRVGIPLLPGVAMLVIAGDGLEGVVVLDSHVVDGLDKIRRQRLELSDRRRRSKVVNGILLLVVQVDEGAVCSCYYRISTCISLIAM